MLNKENLLNKNKRKEGDGEMAQQLQALIVLAEGSGSVLGTYMVAHSHL